MIEFKYFTLEQLQKMNKTRLVAYRKTVYRERGRIGNPYKSDCGDLIFDSHEECVKVEEELRQIEKYLTKVNRVLADKG